MLMLDTFDLTNCICLVTVISTVDTASCVFLYVIFLSAVALLVRGKSFHYPNAFS